VSAHTGPPGKDRAPGLASGGAEDGAAAGGTSTLTLAERPDIPRWTGCPAGCGDYHEHEPVPLHRCNFCTSLDHSARESLHDCSSVCPIRQVA
jgi:hypothetical protein